MKSSIKKLVNELNRRKLNQRRFATIVIMLSLMVTFGVVWGLHGIGISMANEVDCGRDEHVHGSSCYERNLTCGLSEGDIVTADGKTDYHTHSDSCFTQKLICPIEEHRHTVACVKIDTETVTEALNVTAKEEGLVNSAESGATETTTESKTEAGENQISEGGEIASVEIIPAEGEEVTEEIISEETSEELEEISEVVGENNSFSYPSHGTALPVDSNLIYDQFYVVTKLGDRHKDRIHEYLARATAIRSELFDTYVSDGYVKNFYVDASYGGSRQYFLYPGYEIVVAIYTVSDRTDFNESDFQLTVNTNNYLKVSNVQTESLANGVKRVTAEIRCAEYKRNSSGEEDPSLGRVTEAGRAALTFGSDTFYMYTQLTTSGRTNDEGENYSGYYFGKKLTHADIEVTDGGTYEITTIINYPGTSTKPAYSEKIVTQYESFVSDVHSCKIYDNSAASGEPIKIYTDNYYVQAKIDGQSTQYEVTSRDEGAKDHWDDRMDPENVKCAVFDVDMNLYPISATKTTYSGVNGTGSQVGDTEPYRVDEEDLVVINNAIFKLDRQSIIDALNKCPNNTGFDFNVVSKQINININPPLTPEFKVKKGYDATTDKVFEFEIYDENDSPAKLLTTIQTSPGEFPGNQLLTYVLESESAICTPGKYTYSIKEKVPAGAQYIGVDQYYKDGVVYDARTIKITYTVELDGDLGNLYSTYDNIINADMGLVITDTKYEYLNGAMAVTNDTLEFNNVSADYENISLKINKTWADGNQNHGDDTLFFRVICKKDGTEVKLPNHDSNIFSLPVNGGWSLTINDLPQKTSTGIYTYEVEEIPVLGYTPTITSENIGGVLTFNVTNTPTNTSTISIQKKWMDSDGVTPLDESKIPNTSIEGKITRKFKDVAFPIAVLLKDPEYPKGHTISGYDPEEYPENANGGGLDKIFTFDVYQNSITSSFINDEKGNNIAVTIADSNNCTAEMKYSTRLDVTDIQGGANVVLEYPKLDESVFLLHQTTGADFNDWGNVSLNGCWSTCHSYVAGDRNTMQAYNRKADYNMPRYELKLTDIIPGQTYTIGAYVRATNIYSSAPNTGEEALAGDNYELALKLIWWDASSIDEDGKEKGIGTWTQITAEKVRVNEWQHLSSEFTIPATAEKAYLVITTNGESGQSEGGTSGRYTDLYFDDVYITDSGVDYAINAEGEIRKLVDSSFSNVYNAVSSSTVTDWTDETLPATGDGPLEKWSKTASLNSGNSWKYTFSSEVLAEDPTRVYLYDVTETTYLELFKTSYNNTGVAENTADEPMEIINTYSAYTLPNTGGNGVRKMQALGIILTAAATFSILYRNKRKRRLSG